jgi:hypothetical protein
MVALGHVHRQLGLASNPQSHNFDHGAAAKKTAVLQSMEESGQKIAE